MPALPHGTGPSGTTISDPNPLIPRNLSHDGAVWARLLQDILI